MSGAAKFKNNVKISERHGSGEWLAERVLLEVVVHRMRPQDLALPDGLGMQPGSITVTDEGLTIGFVPKPLS